MILAFRYMILKSRTCYKLQNERIISLQNNELFRVQLFAGQNGAPLMQQEV